jgi:hypothetical protein
MLVFFKKLFLFEAREQARIARLERIRGAQPQGSSSQG